MGVRSVNHVIQEDVEKLLSQRKDLDRLDHQSILISGADSFLMSYFVYLVLEHNRRGGGDTKILALCRSRKNAEARFSSYIGDANLELLLQDVREPVVWDGDISICIHAASPVGVQSRWGSALDTFQANVYGCQNMLELARKKQSLKFLLLSSIDVYGEGTGRRRESDFGGLDWTYQRNAYACGKRGAETLCGLYYAQYGLPCVTARPVQVYGPGLSLTDGRLHGDFIRQLREHSRIVLKSDGSAVRSFLYLSDAANALLDLLFYGAAGEAYNVCDEAGECSVRELAGLYAARWGNGAEVIFDESERDTPEVKGALSIVTGDSTKLRSLGWKSGMTLEAGISRTLKYYRDSV